MMIKWKDTNQVNNSITCVVNEYNFDMKTLGVALSSLDQRYPEKRKIVNKECDKIYFVLSGEADVYLGEAGKEMKFHIEEKDGLFIAKKVPYYVEANKLEIVAVTAPAWYPEQHREVD